MSKPAKAKTLLAFSHDITPNIAFDSTVLPTRAASVFNAEPRRMNLVPGFEGPRILVASSSSAYLIVQ